MSLYEEMPARVKAKIDSFEKKLEGTRVIDFKKPVEPVSNFNQLSGITYYSPSYQTGFAVTNLGNFSSPWNIGIDSPRTFTSYDRQGTYSAYWDKDGVYHKERTEGYHNSKL